MICVDHLRHYGGSADFRWAWSCHCYDDAGDLEALHRFAALIGMRRAWFQDKGHGKLPHYDLNARRRVQAIRQGAHDVDDAKFVADVRAARERWRAAAVPR